MTRRPLTVDDWHRPTALVPDVTTVVCKTPKLPAWSVPAGCGWVGREPAWLGGHVPNRDGSCRCGWDVRGPHWLPGSPSFRWESVHMPTVPGGRAWVYRQRRARHDGHMTVHYAGGAA